MSRTELTLLRDVELRHLVALRAVAEERSFGRAAERLGFTQSAVSQQIAALERLVGEQLFHRPGGPRPVEVTPAGRVLLAHADAILDRLGQAESDLAGFKSGTSGRIEVGTYQSVSVRVLPEIVRRLRGERPDVDVRAFESDVYETLITRLVAGELDLTFAVAPVPGPGVRVVELFEDPFVLVSPAGAGPGPSVETGSLAALSMIGNRENDACQMRIDSSLRAIGLQPRYVFRSGDNAAVQAMVRAGSGHAVMPLLAVDTTDRSVCVRRLDPPIPARRIVIAHLADRPPSPAAERFLELAEEVGRERRDGLESPVRLGALP